LIVALRTAAQRRRDDLEVRELGRSPLDHRAERRRVQLAQIVVATVDLEAEAGGEVLFVADHHIDVRRQPAVHLARPIDAADSLPQARSVVEVVRHDRAVARGGEDGLLDDVGCGLRQRREDPPGVEPAHPELAEQVLPVDLPGRQLRRGGVAAVRHAERSADAEAALGEVEPVADRSADAVVGCPANERGIDTPLEHEILDQPADVVVSESRDDRAAQPEAAAQAASNVVLSPALPDAEFARGAHAILAGIEAQHHLAERDNVVATIGCVAEGERAHEPASPAIRTASAESCVTVSNSPPRTSSGATIQLPPTAATYGRLR
jgi:hypothetical protein